MKIKRVSFLQKFRVFITRMVNQTKYPSVLPTGIAAMKFFELAQCFGSPDSIFRKRDPFFICHRLRTTTLTAEFPCGSNRLIRIRSDFAFELLIACASSETDFTG